MAQLPIVIVGGGLAGLVAARLLHRAGIAFELLEARNRLGGRVLTVDGLGHPSADGFDLGPSWIWPDMQPEMATLVAELGLHLFAQNSTGDMLFERASSEAPLRHRGFEQEPASMRIVGGTAAVIEAIARDLPQASLRLGTRATHVARVEQGVAIRFADAEGGSRSLIAGHAILALPPRLLEAGVSFDPALEAPIACRWRETPTWMAPHAKLFAIYARPFWREAGLSGMAQSLVGPLAEIHDATTASGRAALFGFVGLRAVERRRLGEGTVTAASIAQLARLFGPEAAHPLHTLFKDWAADPCTATAEDLGGGEHPQPDSRPWIDASWDGRISLASSETGTRHPGYLAGAVEAATRAAAALIKDLFPGEF